nr:hypothetical protein [Tanacetum cinerariifolium]
MASFDYRLNPLYPIKECSSSEALYTTDYCCSDGSPGDKIICDLDKTPDLSQRSPQNCPKCGNPVDSHYCQGCALLRKKFKEDLFTYCIENGILQDSSEPTNDNTNIVNDLQEPFVFKQDLEEQEANIDTQPSQYSVIPQPPQEEISAEFLQEKRNQMDSVKTFLRKFNRISFYEMQEVLSLAWETILEIKLAFEEKNCQPEDILELFQRLHNNVQNIHEELAVKDNKENDKIRAKTRQNQEQTESVEKSRVKPDKVKAWIRDIWMKRIPLMHNIISLRRRLVFFDRRRWDLDGIISKDTFQQPQLITIRKMLKALLSNKEKLQELANTPLNENCSAVILKKLPKKLRNHGKFLISCGFSVLKCKAQANLGASINLMPLSVWKKLGLPELISSHTTLEPANRAICTPTGIARDVFVSVGKFTFLADFVIVDYESDHRVPLILGRPFLRTARALIDVYGEEMILRDGDERLTLNMRHDTSSYSNQPQKESINLINVFNNSNDIFDPEGGNVLPEKLLDLDYTKDLHPPLYVNLLSGSTTYSSSSLNHLLEEFADELAFLSKHDDDLQFDIESDLKEIEFLLYQDIDSSLKDSIDQ